MRWRWTAVTAAAAAVSLCACAGAPHSPNSLNSLNSLNRSARPVVQARASTQSLVTRSLANRAHIRVPADWSTALFRGAPAPTYFPLRFFSSDSISGLCAQAGYDPRCESQNWFPPNRRAPSDGVILLWGYSEQPGSYHYTWGFVPGRHTVFDHRPAKIRSGAATDSCPISSASELDADVREDAHAYPGEYFTMTACFGRSPAPGERRDVYAMVGSLRINRR